MTHKPETTVLKASKEKLPFEESDRGAHYYAFSPVLSTSQYSEAFGNIVLPINRPAPEKKNFQNVAQVSTQYKTRNGYICFGLTDNSGQKGVDVGLANTGNGWYPYYYDFKSGLGGNFTDYTAGKEATNAEMVVKYVSNICVGLYVRFTTANGTQVGPAFDNNDLIVQNTTWSRFCRFASLVPSVKDVPDIRTDSTYMTNAKFTNLGLYNRNTGRYDAWGIYTGLVSDAWTMYQPKCQVSTTTTSDSFTIDHWS